MSERPAIVGVVLAAGASRRLGRPKQVALLDGEALVRRAARTLAHARCARVAVVVGAHAAATTAALAGMDVPALQNPHWQEGIAASIRTAARWAVSQNSAGLLLAVCDQPLLTTAHVDALLSAFEAEGRPIGSAYAGVVGIPAVFGRSSFDRLMQLRGDRGASALLREGAGAVTWPDGAVDIDTEASLGAISLLP